MEDELDSNIKKSGEFVAKIKKVTVREITAKMCWDIISRVICGGENK